MHPLTIHSSHAMRALAITASMLASYAAFSLEERLQRSWGFWQRRMWMAGAATVLGLGMWSMHYFGALEDPTSSETVYSLRLVVLSLLLAISVSWVSFQLLASRVLRGSRLVSSGLVLGFGVASMHIVAVGALRSSAVADFRLPWALFAVAVGVSLTLLALWMAFGEHKDLAIGEWMRVAGGGVMGVAMAAMHMLALRAVTLVPTSVATAQGSARGSAVGEIAVLVTVGLVVLVTLSTAAVDKRRYRDLARLHAELAASQQALLRSESQLREANALLSELSIRDGLTGLYNRRRFDQVFEMEWRRSLRSLRPLALLMIDVDCFKSLNDSYGHQRGDDCLREIARVLEEQPRRGHDMVARFGGEEFAVLLPGADVAGALRIAENIRRAVEAQKIEHARSSAGPFVTVSIGVSSRTPQAEDTLRSMLYDADMALYLAKQMGRNRVELREPAKVEA